MNMHDIPFGTTDWSGVERTEHPGETGKAFWRTRQFGAIRVRMVEYTPGYLADHWCSKGHILLCLEGELHTELADGRTFVLTPGMTYQVADDTAPHRSSTDTARWRRARSSCASASHSVKRAFGRSTRSSCSRINSAATRPSASTSCSRSSIEWKPRSRGA